MARNKKTNQDVRYEVITQEDPVTGDLLLPIPPEVLESLGWKEGDDVEFDIGPKGEIFIKKASK